MSRFIAPFRQFFLKATDAPCEYGEAAALMTLSSIALGRREVDSGTGVRLNLYMMLAGDSSVARKSTSVVFAKRLLQDVDDQRVGPRDYTMEGLLKWMAEKDPGTKKTRNKVALFSEEFGADLARMEAYASTMPGDFCALYDGETFEKVRAKSGSFRVERPRVNLFAAAAYHMLKKFVKPTDWLNGFYMRFLFVAPLQMRPEFLMQPVFPAAEYSYCATALKTLRDDLKHSAQTNFKMRFDPHAEQLYGQVLAQLRAYTKTLGPVQQTYLGRFGVNVMKLAALYQLDMDPFSPITALAVQTALHFATQICWPSFTEAYRQSALGEFETLFASVYETLQRGPISRLDLARQYWGNEQLDRVVQYMKVHGIAMTLRGPPEKLVLNEHWQQMVAQANVVGSNIVPQLQR